MNTNKKFRIAMGAGLASVMALSVVPAPAFADTGSDESSFVNKLNGLRASKGTASPRCPRGPGEHGPWLVIADGLQGLHLTQPQHGSSGSGQLGPPG